MYLIIQHSATELVEIAQLTEQMHALQTTPVKNKRTALQLQVIKNEFDGFIAAECVLCGEIAVQSIDQPLADAGDTEALLWSLPQ